MRRFLIWSGAVLVLLLAGVLLDSRRAAAAAPLGARPDGKTPPAGLPFFPAAVLLQRTDCTGNLRILDLIHRAGVAERVRLETIWYVGPAQDTLAIRRLLPTWTAAVPLRRASGNMLRDLAGLGHRSSPVLLLFDHEGRVRLTSQSPRSLREFAGLRRAIEGLTWIEEL